MPPRRSPETVLRRRFRALARALPAAAGGDSEAVHKARVASRRVREAMPVLLADAPGRRRRKLRRRVERVTRALGPVRELDVSLAVVDELAASLGPSERPALMVLRGELEAERAAACDRLPDKLERIRARRLPARAARLWRAAEGAPLPELSAAAVLLIRLTRRVDALEAAIDAAGPLYAADPIHQVRIAVKKLRYAFELAHDLALLRSSRAIARLRSVQQTLGRLNDLQVLVSRAEALRAKAPHLHAAPMGALVAALESRCRMLHARYLAARGALVAGANAALAETAVHVSAIGDAAVDRAAVR